MGYTQADIDRSDAGRAAKMLAAAYVPRDLGRDWADGKLTDVQLFTHPRTGVGPCLYIGEIEGKEAWRALADLCRFIRPEQITFRTIVPSMIKRCEEFRGEKCFYDRPTRRDVYNEKIGAMVSVFEGPRGQRYWAEGDSVTRFLESLGIDV